MSAAASRTDREPAPNAGDDDEDVVRVDARGNRAPSASTRSVDRAANEPLDGAERNNLVKRTVDEMNGLMDSMHEHREELFARGIAFHLLNAMIELGARDKIAELQPMIATAAEASRSSHGSQAIDRDELSDRLSELIVLEKELRHVKHLARKQGVLMQALNPLTQLMRQNPGDRGERAINTLIAYADAAGIDLSRSHEILGSIEEEKRSVLPEIDRSAIEPAVSVWASVLQPLAIGLLLTVLMFAFVV